MPVPVGMEIVSQAGLLVVTTVSTPARVSQTGMVVVSQAISEAVVSQTGMLVVSQVLPSAFVSQTGLLVITPKIYGVSNYLCGDFPGGSSPVNYLVS